MLCARHCANSCASSRVVVTKVMVESVPHPSIVSGSPEKNVDMLFMSKMISGLQEGL